MTNDFSIVTYDGNKLRAPLDEQLMKDFVDAFPTFHKKWEPIYPGDLKLRRAYDFFDLIVNRVRKYNESYDITIVGNRGLGKSAFGLGAAKIINAKFRGRPDAQFSLDQVCFDVDDWIEVTSKMSGHGGGVVILDEVGTEGSLSSRTSMSKENRSTSDIIQLMRTDRIITIYISTDRDRIDKRVRQLTSVMTTPLAKLNDEDTGGAGLAIEADIKYSRTRPVGANDWRKKSNGVEVGYLTHEIMPIQFAPKGRIYSVVVPHAPVDLWAGYEAKRAKKLEDVRLAGLVANDGNTEKKVEEEMRSNRVNTFGTSLFPGA